MFVEQLHNMTFFHFFYICDNVEVEFILKVLKTQPQLFNIPAIEAGFPNLNLHGPRTRS